jgi:hypothetical protein
MATRTRGTKRPATRRPGATPPRRRTIATRRTPQKSGMAKVMEGVAGVLPGASAKKGSGGGGKGRTAGLALLAGAAGLALKNRDKLQGVGRRKGSDTGDRTAHADAPAHPVVVTERPAAPPPASA